MKHAWISDVLEDLTSFASDNDLPRLVSAPERARDDFQEDIEDVDSLKSLNQLLSLGQDDGPKLRLVKS